MRILHLADLHIGKLFFNVHLTNDQADILDQAADLAGRERVDAVVVSGDVYDRSVPPVEATEVLDRFLSRLVLDLQIPTIVIPGNHDSAERVSFGSRLLAKRGLHIAADPHACAPITLHDEHGPVTFIPLPYIEPISLRRHMGDVEITDFTDAYRHLLAGLTLPGRSVCIAHCYTAGGEESESERPLSIGGSCHVDAGVFAPFHLTLLGHLHRPQRIGETIWYAGSPLRYSFSELNHPKEFSIFDLDEAGKVSRTGFPVRPKRDLRLVSGSLEEIIAAAGNDERRDDYVAITLTDRGTLFDYAARIREQYPNVVSIVREQREGTGGAVSPGELRRLTDREILAGFFSHVHGELLEEEENLLLEVLDQLNRSEGDTP